MMLYCPACNDRVDENMDFCSHCGTSLKKTDKENYNLPFKKRRSIKNRPIGYIILASYETIFGILLILLGLYIFSLFIKNLNELNLIIGVIVILIGGLGIVGAILFLQWKNEGYTLSVLFLIITGVLFLLVYFIPTIAMFIFIFYLYHN